MTPTDKYYRFAWIAPYIRTVRYSDYHTELEFPPNAIEDMDTLRQMLGERAMLGIDPARRTIIYFTFCDVELFNYLAGLWAERYNYVFSFPVNPAPAVTQYSVKFELAAHILEEFEPNEDELYQQCISGMENGRLDEQLLAAIAAENYEHAAIIRDEITRRKNEPRNSHI